MIESTFFSDYLFFFFLFYRLPKWKSGLDSTGYITHTKKGYFLDARKVKKNSSYFNIMYHQQQNK